jgi:DUF4097 and DUF4098 domain-containing protein YvlB
MTFSSPRVFLPAPRFVGASLLLLLLLTPAPALAQQALQDWCSERSIGRNQHCEVRQITMRAGTGELSIDVGANGSIRVEGYDGADVRVTAQVLTRAGSAQAARELAEAVEVHARDGAIRATGRRTTGQNSWSVNVRVQVPTGTAVTARTTNGAVNVRATHAGAMVRTTNGSIDLADVAGRIDARSTNGSVRATISPAGPITDGVQLRTTNGAIHLALPETAAARLELSTTNGSITTDIPISVQGRVNRRQLSGVIGAGGPEIRVNTTNGGIRITRR